MIKNEPPINLRAIQTSTASRDGPLPGIMRRDHWWFMQPMALSASSARQTHKSLLCSNGHGMPCISANT